MIVSIYEKSIQGISKYAVKHALYMSISMLFAIIFLTGEANATVYYVTQNGSGTLTGNSYVNAMPLATFNLKTTFVAGDSIYLCDKFVGVAVTPLSHGSAGKPIVISGGYTGHPGIIDGNNIAQNGVRRTSSDCHDLTVEYLEIKNIVSCGIRLSPDSDNGVGNYTIQHCNIHDITVNTAGSSGITLSGSGNKYLYNTITNVGGDGIYIFGGNNTELGYNTISKISQYGGWGVGQGDCIQKGSGSAGSNIWIHHNYLDHCDIDCKSCIMIDVTTNTTIEFNTCIGGSHGITCANSTALIARYNTIKNSFITALACDNASCSWYYNNISGVIGLRTTGQAFGIEPTTVSQKMYIYNNTVYDIHGVGLRVITTDTATTIVHKNNLYSAIDSSFVMINSTTAPIVISNYNLYYDGNTEKPFVRSRSQTSLADFTTATRLDSASIVTNPHLSNFQLMDGSSAINAGTNVSLTSDFSGQPILGIPDIGSYEYQLSTLKPVDTSAPVISSVTLSPSVATLAPGDLVTIIATASGSETGLTASDATILGKKVHLAEVGSGTYQGAYTVQAGDASVQTPLFIDDFGGGNLSKWTSYDSNIAVGNQSFHKNSGVECSISSTTQKFMYKELGQNYSDTYTSFSFKLDSGFTMKDRSQNYIIGMLDYASHTSWLLNLDKTSGIYKLSLQRYSSQTMGRVTILPGKWYQIKVHYLSGTSGRVEWWLDGVSQAVYTGDTSGASSGILYGIYLRGIDAGTIGKIYWDAFQITQADQSINLQAKDITLTDAAKNVSASSSSSVFPMIYFQSSGVGKIAAERPLDQINDLSVVRSSETFVILRCTPPSEQDVQEYVVEAEAQNSENNGWFPDEVFTFNPVLVSSNDHSFKLKGLQPGCNYSFAIRYRTSSGKYSPVSNHADTITLVRFDDENIDQTDPFITRDADSLFVASNGLDMKFRWSSWEASGAKNYEVDIRKSDSIQIVSSNTVQDTLVVFKGEPNTKYFVEVRPKSETGATLGKISSRQIICKGEALLPPGKPKIVVGQNP